MPSEEFDPFGLSSGLADDYDFTFKNVHFGTDAGYVDNEGNMPTVFMVDVVTDDDDAGTQENQILSIGKGWEMQDRGAYVTKNGTMEANFNKNTRIGQFLQAAFECEGGEELLRKRYETTQLVPQQAAFWEGLRGHMKLKTIETNIRGEKSTRDNPLPTKLYGWDAAPEAKAAPVKKAVAKKKAAAKPPAEEAEAPAQSLSAYQTALAEVPGAVKAKLKLIAGESNDADEFIDRAYKEIEGIDDDENIMAVVDDTDDPESIWAIAMAEYQAAQAG